MINSPMYLYWVSGAGKLHEFEVIEVLADGFVSLQDTSSGEVLEKKYRTLYSTYPHKAWEQYNELCQMKQMECRERLTRALRHLHRLTTSRSQTKGVAVERDKAQARSEQLLLEFAALQEGIDNSDREYALVYDAAFTEENEEKHLLEYEESRYRYA